MRVSEYVFGLWQNRVKDLETQVAELQENFAAMRQVLELIRKAVSGEEME